jgi:apolipoprotein N-acyltransferase
MGPDHEELTERAAASGSRLIVLSEEDLGTGFWPERPDDETRAEARKMRLTIVAGYSDGDWPKPHNCAALILPDGHVGGVYRKIHLFLGEYQSVAAGTQARSFDSPLGRIGMEICFDTLYTVETRALARDGAQIIAVPNFDPPTPEGVLHELHTAVIPFRAVENRVAVVRADSNGCSQIVDPTGRVVAQAALWVPEAVVAPVSPGNGKGTPFMLLGDWFACLCAVMTAAAAVRLAGINPLRFLRFRAGICRPQTK